MTGEFVADLLFALAGIGVEVFVFLNIRRFRLCGLFREAGGLEFGDGFAASRMKGSEHNDALLPWALPSLGRTQPQQSEDGLGRARTAPRQAVVKNGAGGVNGGITNGAPIVFRVAFKPTSSIAKTQKTLNIKTGETVDLNVPGRHDVCFALRTPVIVEAVAAIVLAGLIN